MPRVRLGEMTCSIARTVEIIGERWTPLILRDVFGGVTRFDAIQEDLGIPRNVLTQRLETLIGHGVLERVAYQHNPPRYDYLPTEKGRGLGPILLAMLAWGDRWTAGEAGPPVLMRHERCGQVAQAVASCSSCGEPLNAEEISLLPGPGLPEDPAPGTAPVRLAAALAAGRPD